MNQKIIILFLFIGIISIVSLLVLGKNIDIESQLESYENVDLNQEEESFDKVVDYNIKENTSSELVKNELDGVSRDVDSSLDESIKIKPSESSQATVPTISKEVERTKVEDYVTVAEATSDLENENHTPVKWGVFSGYTANELKQFEDLVGSAADMRGVFVNWEDPFPTYFGQDLKRDNKAMVIYWEHYGVTLDEIINGDSDDYIRKFADEARSYGGEVILSPLHEMNGDWDPWGGMVGSNTPAKVVKTWQHIFDTFGKVTNVKFAWAVNNVSVPNYETNAIKNYYPGSKYVDYVAVDGFNFGNPWQSFDEIFSDVLIELSQYNKPIYILSMASAEGSQKALWIRDAFEIQLPKYPLVKGWIWFNENKERDWRVNSDNNSLSAFKSAIK